MPRNKSSRQGNSLLAKSQSSSSSLHRNSGVADCPQPRWPRRALHDCGPFSFPRQPSWFDCPEGLTAFADEASRRRAKHGPGKQLDRGGGKRRIGGVQPGMSRKTSGEERTCPRGVIVHAGSRLHVTEGAPTGDTRPVKSPSARPKGLNIHATISAGALWLFARSLHTVFSICQRKYLR